jgi:hypothetical protein
VDERSLRGGYRFEDGTFVPTGDMVAINERRSCMALLADIGDGVPSFYLDPGDGSYWMYQQSENYETTLTSVSREWIRTHYPTVDLDRPLPD